MVEITIQLHNSTEDVYKAGELLQGECRLVSFQIRRSVKYFLGNVEVILGSEKKFKGW